MPNWKSLIPLDLRNCMLFSGYASGHNDLSHNKNKKILNKLFPYVFFYIEQKTDSTDRNAYMIERRPRVLRKEKLVESGNPDRKIPLSTMAKFNGGSRLNSSPVETSSNGVVPADGGGDTLLRWSTLATSIVWKILLPSSFSSSLIDLFIVFSISFILKTSSEGLSLVLFSISRFGYGEVMKMVVMFRQPCCFIQTRHCRVRETLLSLL